MFHNYFFLKRLAKDLNEGLTGLKLVECFSQNKNELLLAFASREKEVWIRANLDPQIGLIQVTDTFKRARKNSVDLFVELLDLNVTSVETFQFDRSFSIHFGNGYQLIFKMQASRSNIILMQKNANKRIFRSQLPNDNEIGVGDLNQPLSIDFDRFRQVDGVPSKFIPALGKEVREYLFERDYEKMELESKWTLMLETLDQLDTSPIFIYKSNEVPKLSLLPHTEKNILETYSAIEAANKLYEEYTHYFYLGTEKRRVIKSLESSIKKTMNYVLNSRRKLEEVKNRRSYEEIANIIMANLHAINKGEKKVTLTDFYNDTEISIKLNPDLTPQKNAENLYRKSRNQKIEIEKLEENIREREAQLAELEQQLEEAKKTQDFRSLRKEFQPITPKKEDGPKPYHQYSFRDYDILIGKNAKANDQLTLKIANKEDYWLHARDVAGSHVVIRHQAGKKLPKDVLERAAELAAWYSKRKTDSLCPVIHTQKKYVRKAKGSPPGLVIVEKEAVIMVEPKGFEQ